MILKKCSYRRLQFIYLCMCGIVRLIEEQSSFKKSRQFLFEIQGLKVGKFFGAGHIRGTLLFHAQAGSVAFIWGWVRVFLSPQLSLPYEVECHPFLPLSSFLCEVVCPRLPSSSIDSLIFGALGSTGRRVIKEL